MTEVNPTLSEMVKALRAEGVTSSAIAQRVGCDASTIYRIREGLIADPKHSIASAIQSIYTERFSQSAA